ncbi:MAG: proteasome-type protease [Ilumatobacter sp.]|uniref:proteasome-type protease n=1 Tax=Ilumatobacter sp. TaxID=1967498 RepID=UPI00329861D9
MTFCIGIRVDAGIVVLSDTRVVTGSETSRKSKLSTLTDGRSEAVVMTSGLRSVRDKVVARMQDRLSSGVEFDRFHEFASAYGDELRAVRAEDEPSLAEGGLTFDSHAILAGRFPGDVDPVLMHVYPEGNWVEATDDAPYFVIGRSSYGKPILDRLLRAGSTLEHAISLAYLAFDATAASSTDVDFPIDIGVQPRDQEDFTMQRFTQNDMEAVHAAWHDHLHAALDRLPTPWSELVGTERSA